MIHFTTDLDIKIYLHNVEGRKILKKRPRYPRKLIENLKKEERTVKRGEEHESIKGGAVQRVGGRF